MDISQDIALMRMNYNKAPQKTLSRATKTQADNAQFNKELKEASDGFEEVFVHKLLQIMRSSVPKEGLMSGGRGEEIFQDMLDENYAKLMTKSKALGLSNLIYEHTKKTEPR